ncbi:MAG: Type 1 glutamine amidotransferase-like domain-containing protein [Hyphomicrobiales bacterium]
MGYVLLEGGSEFTAGMTAADERAMALAGGRAASIRIVPAAAAPDDNHEQAGTNGVGWFQGLGATDVRSIRIIDRGSADRPELALELEAAKMVFMLGGFTRYLAETLTGSRAWQAMAAAHRAGAVIAGSSAGAMVLCEHYFDQASGQVLPGLNLVPGSCVLPHHNRFGHRWQRKLSAILPDTLLIGIDEETGMLNDGPGGRWTVYGGGAVTLYFGGTKTVLRHGHFFDLPSAKA